MESAPHRIAFYADTFYNPELLRSLQMGPLSYWIPPGNLDVEAILLGGDINYSPENLGAMVRDIRLTQHPETYIIAVPGNGDYIDQEIGEARHAYHKGVDSVPNAVFLDDAVLVLPSGLRVIGSTLWDLVREDKIAEHDQKWRDRGMAGVDNIRIGDRPLSARDVNAMYADARKFIEHELRSLSPAERRETVVCTHFWPTLRPWRGNANVESDDWFISDESNMDAALAEYGPSWWLCGHIHETLSVTVGLTQVASNPRMGDGPDNVNVGFSETYIVEIPRAS